MSLNGFFRYLAGNVTFEAKNGFGERLINLCAGNNLSLWDFHKTQEGFTARCAARDYKLVKRMSKRVNVEVSVVRKRGLLFRAGKYRKRWGIFVGLAAFLAFIFLSQCFVWEIEITGNSNVPESVILSELDSIGVGRFRFIPGIDFQAKKQQALLKLPKLSYLSINREGCRLRIDVTERVPAPVIRDETPCDVIASRTGQIKYMEVYEGETVVGLHYTVGEGDLIVSGTYVTKRDELVTVHADARVIAEVQFDKTLSLDLGQLAKEYTGETKTRYFLNLFSLKAPLFLAFPMKGDFDAEYQSNPIELFGQTMPFGVDSIHYRFYHKKEEEMTIEQAREVLRDSFLQYELGELKGTAILDRRTTEKIRDGVYSMTIAYTAEQDIAKQVPIGIR